MQTRNQLKFWSGISLPKALKIKPPSKRRFGKSRRLYFGNNRPLQFNPSGTVFLKFNQTKCVKLRRNDNDELKLVVEDEADGSLLGQENVQVWKSGNYIALCINYGSDSYLVTVDDTELKYKQTTDVRQDIQTLETYFEKFNAGMGTSQYLLQTVNPRNRNLPSKYLVISEEDHWSITLSDQKPTDVFSNLLTDSL